MKLTDVETRMLEFAAWRKAHQSELDRAQERIGTHRADSVKWLLGRLHERDLSTLSAGETLDLQWEAWVFLFGQTPTWSDAKVIPSPAAINLETVQGAVTEIVHAALSPGTVLNYRYPSFAEKFALLAGYGPKLVQEFGSDVDIYRHRILHALAPAAPSFARCKACERVYAKRQDDQLFCSFRCQDRIAKRTRRQERRTKPGRSHSQKG